MTRLTCARQRAAVPLVTLARDLGCKPADITDAESVTLFADAGIREALCERFGVPLHEATSPCPETCRCRVGAAPF